MISFVNKQFDQNNFKVWLYTPGGSFLGELLVDNPVLTLQLEGLMSTFEFSLPENVDVHTVGEYDLDSIVNPRINETLDQFQVEVWYGDLDTEGYQKQRFIILETPRSFGNDITRFTYRAFSREYENKFVRVVDWPGIIINEYVDSTSFSNPVDFDSEQTIALDRTPKDERLIRAEIEKDFVYRIVDLTTSTTGYTFTTQPSTDFLKIYKTSTDSLLVKGTDYTVVEDSYTGLLSINFIFGSQIAQGDKVYMEYKLADPIVLQLIRSESSTLAGEFDFYYDDNNDTLKCFIPSIPKVFSKTSVLSYDSTIPTGSSIKVNIYYEATDLQSGDTTIENITKDSLTIDQVIDSLLSYGDEDNGSAKWDAYYSSVFNGVLRSDFKFNNTNLFAALNDALKSYEAIAVPDTINKKFYIYKKDTSGTFSEGGAVVSSYRQPTGLSIEYGKYLRTAAQSISTEDLITVIRGLGLDNITASSASPTGYNEYEDYTYYLDGVFITNMGDVLSTPSTTPILSGSSRWMSDSLATKLLMWQQARSIVEAWLYTAMPNATYTFDGVSYNPSVDFATYTNDGLIQAQDEIIDRIADRESRQVTLKIQETEQNTLLAILETDQGLEHLINWAGTFEGTSYSGIAGYENYILAKKAKLDAELATLESELNTLQGHFNFINLILADLYADIKKDTFNNLPGLNANFDAYVFTADDFVELNGFRREGIYENKFITKASDLYLQMKQEIVAYRQPRVEVTADIIGLLQANEARVEWNNIVLGGLATIIVPRLNIDLQIQIKTLTISPDANSTSITFSTEKNYIGTGQKYLGRFISNAAYNLKNNLGYNEGQWTQAALDAAVATGNFANGFVIGDSNPLTTQTVIVDDDGITTNGYTIDPQNDTAVSAVSDTGRMILYGFVKVNAGRIDVYDRDSSGNIINKVVVSPTGVIHTVGDLTTSMTADGFKIDYDGTPKFSVDQNGNAVFAGALSAATGSFSGTVTATAGSIGGWTINSTSISKNNIVLNASSSAPYIALNKTSYGSSLTGFFLGQTVLGATRVDIGDGFSNYIRFDGTNLLVETPNFSIDALGNVSMAGEVSASSGSIGGWTINSTSISKNNIVLNASSSAPYIALNKTSYGSSLTGFFLGQTVLGATRVDIGDGFSNYIRFDGTNLLVETPNFSIDALGNVSMAGEVSASSGSIGGWTIDNTGLSSGDSKLYPNNTTGLQMSEGSSLDDLTSRYIAGGIVNIRAEIGGPVQSNDFTLNGSRIMIASNFNFNSGTGVLTITV